MAMFTSAQDLVVVIPRPMFVEFDTGTGAGSYSLATTDSEVTLTIYAPGGGTFFSGLLSTLPAGTIGLVSKPSCVIVTIAAVEEVDGIWTFTLDETASTPGATVPVVSEQWGGTVDLLATAATNINDNINGNVGRIQQCVMGNTTWDPGTGTVGMFAGESFVLADEAGTPVSDQSLAVRRINSTV